jgi:hypothetical protein
VQGQLRGVKTRYQGVPLANSFAQITVHSTSADFFDAAND